MRLMVSNNKVLQSSARIMLNPEVTDIIQDASLVYWYDPSRTASYPGTGKYVYDLSGNEYNATLTGEPTFTGNSFNCLSGNDGFGSKISFPLSGGTYGATYNLTITLWFKGSAGDHYQHPLTISGGGGNFEFDLNDTDGGYRYQTMWVYWNSGGNPLSALPLGALGGSDSKSDLLTGTWQCYTFRRDVDNSPYTEHFVNGVKIEDVERLSSQTDDLLYGGSLFIGKASVFVGEVGSSHAYSRALDDAEILANYNAERSRFV